MFIPAMSANVVNDPIAVIETDRPHKSSMALTPSTADKASIVPRRRYVYYKNTLCKIGTINKSIKIYFVLIII